MDKLLALQFDDPQHAEEALKRIQAAIEANEVTLLDALTIAWPEGERNPKIQRPAYLTIMGKAIEVVQSLTISLIYVLLTLGSAALFVGRHLFRSAIDTAFINEVREQIAPGTSILVLRTDKTTGDELAALFADMKPTELRTDLFSPPD